MSADAILDTLACRFGCAGPVYGIYHMPKGCICWPDPIQALCRQHLITAESAGPIVPVLERLVFVVPGDAAGAEAPSQSTRGQSR